MSAAPFPTSLPGPDVVKVLQFVTVFAIGGTERQVMNLSLGLDPRRFDVSFACLKRGGDFLGTIEDSGKPLAAYPIQRLYGPHAASRQLRFARDLRRDRIEVVHTYGFYPNVFAIPAARLAGTPAIVASIRDTGDHLTPRQRLVQRLTCRLADGILVNAEAIRDRLVADGYDAARIGVITNGVSLSRFGPRRAEGRVRRELGLPAGAPLVAVVSRLSQLKGIEYFLEAAALVAPRFPDARFVIVGDVRVLRDGAIVTGPYRHGLEIHAAKLGLGQRVVFAGSRLDVPELLAEVAISVLPSLSEGLSNAILESMAAGVPVVATRVGGNPEAVRDGVTGLLVPPRDAGALAAAIGALLENRTLAERLGRAGRERVVECFTEDRMVQQTAQFYSTLMARKRRRCATRELAERTA